MGRGYHEAGDENEPAFIVLRACLPAWLVKQLSERTEKDRYH